MPRPPLPRSDHCDGSRFFNPGVDVDKSVADLWRWRRTRTPAAWPRLRDGEAPAPPPGEVGPDAVACTCIGQATVLIQVPGCTILTDPIFSERASPVSFAGPARVRRPGLAFADLPRIDVVLVSHDHYDHLDLPSLRRLQTRFAPQAVTGLGNGRTLSRAGMDGAIELDWWSTVRPCAGVSITFVPAQHWSSRTVLDRRRTLWGGFVIETEAATVFFAGDTGYGPHFAEIARRFRPDVAILPIGAYEPRWFMALQHMNPDDAVRAHHDLGASLSLGVHWGTFQLTDEAVDAPLVALEAARVARGVEPADFVAPGFGETVRWSRAGGARRLGKSDRP